MKNGVAIQLEGVSRTWNSFHLGPIDLTVQQGNVVTIVGNNGSGKSTIFRLILQLLKKDHGSIRFFSQGKELKEMEAKQKIGYVGDQYLGFRHLTVDELASFVSHWYPDWDQAKYQQLKKRYQIDGAMKFENCSTGIQKKVEWILALSHSPQWLLLDEPSAGVDLLAQKKMIEDMMEFMEKDQNCILLASHNPHEVHQVADYIYLLDQGTIVQGFEKDQILEQWGIIWLDQPLPESLIDHPHILDMHTSSQIVTNQLDQLEKEFAAHHITITRFKRLQWIDAIEYLLAQKKKSEGNRS